MPGGSTTIGITALKKWKNRDIVFAMTQDEVREAIDIGIARFGKDRIDTILARGG